MADILQVEPATRAVQGNKHAVEMQSLRGLAALTVVLHHCSFYYVYDLRLKYAAEMLFNGHAAVILFFVLSGYVLTLSLNSAKLDTARVVVFYVRRAFRIYPALWFACLLGGAYALLFWGQPLPAIVHEWWPRERRFVHFTAGATFLTLAGISTPLAIPVWTLFIEILASALMPIFALLIARRRLIFAVVTGMLVVLAACDPNPFFFSRYLIYFALGSWLTVLVPLCRKRSEPPLVAAFLGVLGFGVLWFSRLPFDARFLDNYFAKTPALLEGLGAAILVGVVHSWPKPFTLLRHPAVVWMGDISYSLYLLHLPILGIVAAIVNEKAGLLMFDPLASMAVVTVLTVGASVILSAVTYRWVEIPGIHAGQRVAAWAGAKTSELLRVGPARASGGRTDSLSHPANRLNKSE
jgi:peptidoglycan/LPS O-acetylase OafA/YrhL